MAGVLLQNSLDGGRLGQVLAASAGGANFLALGCPRGVWGALPPAHEVLTACPPAMSSAGSLDERNQPPLEKWLWWHLLSPSIWLDLG